MTNLNGFLPPRRGEGYAFSMGYDCGLHGSNENNCHFSIFSSRVNTRAWEDGKKTAEAEVFMNEQKSSGKRIVIEWAGAAWYKSLVSEDEIRLRRIAPAMSTRRDAQKLASDGAIINFYTEPPEYMVCEDSPVIDQIDLDV